MRFPEELWPDPAECQLVRVFVDAFNDHPLILTDQLANTTYFSEAAEALFAERAEALVNRLALSLLGFGEHERPANGIVEALEGRGAAWDGIVRLQTATGPRVAFVQTSAIRNREGLLVAGVIRIGKVQQA